MTTSAPMGLNRTGAQMSPEDTKRQIEATEQFRQDIPPGDASRITEERVKFIREHEAIDEQVGSVPPPGSVKGVLKTGLDKMMGKNPELLLDKLGERLAYERTGVRLYEAFIAKVAAAPDARPELLETLRTIQQQEAEHMQLLRDSIETLGADPTAMTPCAHVSGTMAQGIIQVLTDPRTNMAQCLNAMLTIELTDNAAWELLIELARQANHPNIASSFEVPMRHEEEHLVKIKTMLRDELKAQLS
ncbi:ferritin-like domain-containing protein [Pseudomonas sp.]|uniref:ferritin-like domain-containing protein n=1 Tax=Pseudomonas sp. TaxID=306 RepID=UPI00289C6242|nr:ferritin-like domain-containing protein [Pseudomonas sp.]